MLTVDPLFSQLVKEENLAYMCILIGFLWTSFLVGLFFLVRVINTFVTARVTEARENERRIMAHNERMGVAMSIKNSKGCVEITAVPINFDTHRNLGSSGLNDEKSEK